MSGINMVDNALLMGEIIVEGFNRGVADSTDLTVKSSAGLEELSTIIGDSPMADA